RLHSLAAATDLVTRNNWVTVPIDELVAEVIAPFDDGRFLISGNRAAIASQDVTNLAMCLHELCTNAVKYGSLSKRKGRVLIEWTAESDFAVLRWREEGGPLVKASGRPGLGSKLLNSGLFAHSGGG